jgi:hypothetical protein
MRNTILSALLIGALATPALADSYPVTGRWGQSKTSETGPIDCAGKRMIDFKGDQRTDSKGSVPAFRNKSVSPAGPSNYRIVDLFSNGQVRNGSVNYTLRLVDADHIEMNMSPGGMLKLQRCG